MKPDPCDQCVLPDCDDRSPRCVLRQAYNRAVAKKRAGQDHLISPIEAVALHDHRDMMTLEYRARKSERAA